MQLLQNWAAKSGFVLYMVLATGSTAAAAEAEAMRPLYEIEAFAVGAYTPDYPGSDQMHAHALALPWITYRGSFLRTDEQGSLRGRFIETNRFGLDVSLMGSFPSHSSDNTARSDMPDLDWMGEIGPKARLTAYTWANQATGRQARINFELPVRAVFSTDFSSIDYRGLLVNPVITYDNGKPGGTRVKLSFGPMFATSELTEYFYQVDSAYARADRPAYNASAGYMGARLGLRSMIPVNDRIKLLGSANYDYLGGSANEDSPLLKEKSNLAVMLGFSISLYRSDEKVPAGY